MTQCVFISQMSSCVLVRIPLDTNGFLLDDQDAWKIGACNEVGDGIEGIHNVSLSATHPPPVAFPSTPTSCCSST